MYTVSFKLKTIVHLFIYFFLELTRHYFCFSFQNNKALLKRQFSFFRNCDQISKVRRHRRKRNARNNIISIRCVVNQFSIKTPSHRSILDQLSCVLRTFKLLLYRQGQNAKYIGNIVITSPSIIICVFVNLHHQMFQQLSFQEIWNKISIPKENVDNESRLTGDKSKGKKQREDVY